MSTSRCTAASVQRAFRAPALVQMSAIFPVDRCGCDGSSSVGGVEGRDDDVWTSSFCCVDSWAIENGPSDSGWAY